MAVGQLPDETRTDGSFQRQRSRFTGQITGEPGRYHLYVSLACPWAHRGIIVRHLMGLEDAISLSVVDPIRDERGWAFRAGSGHGPDPVNGFGFLSEAYHATDPGYEGRYTVPVLWDRAEARIASNDYHTITTQFETAFAARGDVVLYPEHLRAEIDEVNARTYRDVNNGVYRCGFATTQEAYEEAFDALFAALDWLDQRLADRRYLVGDQLTEADVRLFTTLVRFDAVYHGHFKCNLARLVDYPNLWPYARRLFQRPGFGDTTDFDHIKRHYYRTHDRLNPTRIVPKGPAVDWTSPA